MMNIRPLQKSDFGKGFVQTLESLRPIGNLDTEELETIFNHISENKHHHIFVAEEGSNIIGTVTILIEQKFIRQGGRVAHIEDVAVHKDFQGKGIGSKIIEHALAYARTQNCYKAILTCNEHNTPFYEKLGFKKHETEMRKDL
ncbi:MAG: hypothetical protein RJA61_378 [Candidatus Parcubacteria bacterium]|jgi:glucosamine-phosphate N-acetyltransferase